MADNTPGIWNPLGFLCDNPLPWKEDDYEPTDGRYCIECNGVKPNHEAGCGLAELLTRTKEGK